MKNRFIYRGVGAVLAVALAICAMPFVGPVRVVEASNYGLSNPRVTYVTRDTVQFGHYLQEDTNGDGVVNESDEKQPITWQILEKDSAGNALLLADKVLDIHFYNDVSEPVTWETSDVRYWLNCLDSNGNYDTNSTGFLNTAFTSSERALIADSMIVNDDNPTYGTDGGNNTNDKVFFLSISEVTNSTYKFSSYESRIAYATKYVRQNNNYYPRPYGCAYYPLRSPGIESKQVSIIGGSGIVSSCGVYSAYAAGIRPAIKLNLNDAGLMVLAEKKVALQSASWDTIKFGRYNGKVLTWRILSIDGDDAFLLLDKTINNGTWDASFWANNSLRTWLNSSKSGNFYADAFTADEKSAIRETEVRDPGFGVDYFVNDNLEGPTTNDKVFLLSHEEITNTDYGFPNVGDMNSDTRVAYDNSGEESAYTLRSIGPDGGQMIVDEGFIDLTGHLSVDEEDLRVRPALHLDLSKTTVWTKGTTISSLDGYIEDEDVPHTTASADTPTTPSETASQTVTPATVSSVSASDVKLAKGKTKNISAKVSMSDGSKYTGTVTYKSANTKIATVDKNGKVKGVAGGKTTITVSAGGKSKKITVKVADIALESTSFALQKGRSTTVKATLTNDSIKSVKSSNEKIAKVSLKKNVITVKAQNKTGTAKITVTTKQGITKTITVKVQSGKVTTKFITASTKKVTLDKKGKKATVDITINPISSQDKVKVSVKDSKIAKATYKDGKLTITAKKKGSTKVTVKSGKKNVKVTVKVKR